MALTTGKRTTTVTPSATASRMGIVPAYGGDPITAGASALGEALSEEVKRAAVLEEEKWKAKFSIDTYKALNEFALKNKNNPNGFTTSTDAYVDELVNNAPKKYQGWSKQYAGMMAARLGQGIINNHYINNQHEAINLNMEDGAMWLSNTINHLENINYSDWDQNMFDSHLAEFSEKYVSYENMYNSLDPELQRAYNLLEPQVWKRKHQLAFEQARLNSKHKALIESAALIDKEALTGKDENGDGVIYETTGVQGELSNVQVTLNTINSNMEKYINNPKVDDLDGFATLGDTLTEERELLKENSLKFANDLKQNYDIEQNKLKSMNEVEYNRNVDFLFNSISQPGTNYTEQELNNQLNALNVTTADREKITKQNKAKNIIGKFSNLTYNSNPDAQTYSYNGEQLNFNGFNSNLFHDSITQTLTVLAAEGITDYTYDDIKSQIIDHHVFSLTGKNPQELTFSYDFASGQASEDFNLLKNYAVNMGIVPKPLTTFINQNYSEARLNLNIKENRDVLVEMAGMLNVLQETPYAKALGIDGITAEDQILLTQFYKDYKRNFDVNAKRSESMQGSSFIQENDFVKNWFEIRNEYQGDKSDKILTLFGNRINEIGDDVLDNILTDTIDASQLSIFGVNIGSIASPLSTEESVKPLIDVPLLRWFKINDTERADLNVQLGVQRFKEVLPDYLVNYYKANNISERDLALRTTREIEDDIGQIIQYVFSDLNSLGYGFE